MFTQCYTIYLNVTYMVTRLYYSMTVAASDRSCISTIMAMYASNQGSGTGSFGSNPNLDPVIPP